MFLNAVKVFASPSPPSQTQYNGEHFAAEFRRVRRKEGEGGGGGRGVGFRTPFRSGLLISILGTLPLILSHCLGLQ